MTALHTELLMTEKEACIMIKVGLIEDDRLLNESLALLLEKEGYQIYKSAYNWHGAGLRNDETDGHYNYRRTYIWNSVDPDCDSLYL